MDPARFVLKKESNASIKQREKSERKKNKREILLKTCMRPHFIFLEPAELKTFISTEAKEPSVAHPVAGYYKTLRSDVYTNMQGQEIQVRQHWKGEGNIIGRDGWNYQVLIKESPTRMVPYTPQRNAKQPKVIASSASM